MKQETAVLLEKFHLDKRLQFNLTDTGVELQHDLNVEEKLLIVNTEYGPTLAGTLDDLFVAIVRKLIKLAVEKAKIEFGDKLSEL